MIVRIGKWLNDAYTSMQLFIYISTPVIPDKHYILNACKALIDQSIRHFGINYTKC